MVWVAFCCWVLFQSSYVKDLIFFIPSFIGINKKLKEVCSLKSLEVLHYPCNEEMVRKQSKLYSFEILISDLRVCVCMCVCLDTSMQVWIIDTYSKWCRLLPHSDAGILWV